MAVDQGDDFIGRHLVRGGNQHDHLRGVGQLTGAIVSVPGS